MGRLPPIPPSVTLVEDVLTGKARFSGLRTIVEEGLEAAAAEEAKEPKIRGKKKGGKQSRLTGGAKDQFRKKRDKG